MPPPAPPPSETPSTPAPPAPTTPATATTGRLLTPREVAAALGLTRQRIYQLDAELDPVIVRRGEKMAARWYRPDVVEGVRARRAARETSARGGASGGAPGGAPPEATAKAIAARVLEEYATSTPFFKGVRAEDTAEVRAEILAIAAALKA